MNQDGIILGVIIAFELDRKGNDFVVRGSLELFNRPLIKITNDLLESLNLYNKVVYTNQKGIIFKNILDKRVKYIVRKNNYLYTTNSLYNDFKEYLNCVTDILIVDPKYPFLDDILLKELIDKHKKTNSDVTYIKGTDRYNTLVPNVFMIKKEFFVEVFEKEFSSKQLEINYLIKLSLFNHININYIETCYIYKILTVSNGKILTSLESLLLNRK